MTPDAPGLNAACGADEHDLAQRFARGEAAAFDQLVDLYHRRVSRLAQRLLGWSGDAEDVVQEVFLAVLSSQPRLRGQSSLFTWLCGITINKCRAQRRWRMLRLTFLRRMARESATDASPADDEMAEEVRRAVRKLGEKDREVIVLHYLEQMPLQEMAGLLGVKKNAVEVRLHRARARLKGLLANVLGDVA